MVEISNVKVYDLEESINACRNSMRIVPDHDSFENDLVRAKKLCYNPSNSGEINFLKGIRVSMDIKYPGYFSPELQRYHFIDIISSSSKMHRLFVLGANEESFNKYTDTRSIQILQELINRYNANKSYENFMRMLSSCPQGIELFMRISTNYACLRNIWIQRRNHRLKEDWGAFCDAIEKLPYFHDFIEHKNHTV